jgi:hypothetical protein
LNPITHILVSWIVADSSNLDKRERAAVTMSGIIPDIDSFGIIAEQLNKFLFCLEKWLFSIRNHIQKNRRGVC